MTRKTILLLIGGLSVWVGMSGDGCFVLSDLVNLSRRPPAIIPDSPDQATFKRTFAVDLRAYPEVRAITWEFGDGSASPNLPAAAGRSVTHQFPHNGTYTVTVHLFGPSDVWGGGSRWLASGSLPVDVTGPNEEPQVSFVARDATDDTGQPVALTKLFDATRSRDPDGSIASYEWDFGDGTEGTGVTVAHTFTQSGRYFVRLTVTDDSGATNSATQTILANTSPTASFTTTQDPNNALRYTFDATASTDPDGSITTFRWDFGDGSPGEAGQVVVHTYAVPNDYTVVLTVTDELGGVATTSTVLDVTGTEPFVRSVSPALGEVDTTVSDVMIDGENFEDGATVRLEQGATTIDATVTFEGATSLRVSLDLSGAPTGDYTVVVTNPTGSSAVLPSGFQVVTPDLVRLTTSHGDILLQMVDDAPITTANFLQYVQDGFYDGTIFHRVVAGFVVQGGGFLPGMIPQEGVRDPIINEFSPQRSNVRGTVAMAKRPNDPDSATSEFFINLADNSDNLDNQNGGFTVFAQVIAGMDVADAIAAVEVQDNGQGEMSVPVEDVLLISAVRE